jgi:hypothetical protein
MIGYKLFKEREDGSIHMLRIVDMRKPFKITKDTKDPAEITVYDYDTEERKKVRVDSPKEYSPLKPDGIFTASIVQIQDNDGQMHKDVIVTATKYLNIELGLNVMPYAACRQNITDFFYNILTTNPEPDMVGLSVNQDDCPTNFDFGLMFAASDVEFNEFINFYRMDTLEDILKLIKISKYDTVLKNLYDEHVKYVANPVLAFRHSDKGWCDSLKLLLKENNFESDINEMLGITELNINMEDYMIEKPIPGKEDETYDIATDDLKYWLSMEHKINIKEICVIEFDHDINLAEFNDVSYIIVRDSSKKLYILTYIVEGEYYEADLIAKDKELCFSDKFRIDFYNKYNTDNK